MVVWRPVGLQQAKRSYECTAQAFLRQHRRALQLYGTNVRRHGVQMTTITVLPMLQTRSSRASLTAASRPATQPHAAEQQLTTPHSSYTCMCSTTSDTGNTRRGQLAAVKRRAGSTLAEQAYRCWHSSPGGVLAHVPGMQQSATSQ
jgi:hypothetical protein